MKKYEKRWTGRGKQCSWEGKKLPVEKRMEGGMFAKTKQNTKHKNKKQKTKTFKKTRSLLEAAPRV